MYAICFVYIAKGIFTYLRGLLRCSFYRIMAMREPKVAGRVTIQTLTLFLCIKFILTQLFGESIIDIKKNMSEEIEEQLKELKTYTTIYEKLCNTTELKSSNGAILSQSEVMDIQSLTYERIYSVLNNEPIFHIIATEWSKMKEDFVHYVLSDTKYLIKIIEKYLIEKL